MIDYETYSRIKHYQREGLKTGQIAQKLALDTRTVESWLEEPQYRQRKKGEAHSKLDLYKDAIVSLLEKYPYSATQLYQRIQDEGYEGSYSLVSHYVYKIRPKRKPAFLTLAFAPGESAQVDWGIYKTIEVGATRRKLNFFAWCYAIPECCLSNSHWHKAWSIFWPVISMPLSALGAYQRTS